MAFWLACPGCGRRSVEDFRFGGERLSRPAPDAATAEWTAYFHNRKNAQGLQQEWWYHRMGCRKWFIAIRDTRDNSVARTMWPADAGPADADN